MVRTRAALRRAMTELLAEQPFEALTVREIAARAGVGYATFFRRYPDKEALLYEVAELLMSELLQVMLPARERRDTAAMSQEVCRFTADHAPVCRAILAGGAEGMVRAEMVRRAMGQVLSRSPRAPADALAELLVFHSVSATLNLLAWWLRTHEELNPAVMAQALDALVLVPATRFAAGERFGAP